MTAFLTSVLFVVLIVLVEMGGGNDIHRFWLIRLVRDAAPIYIDKAYYRVALLLVTVAVYVTSRLGDNDDKLQEE